MAQNGQDLTTGGVHIDPPSLGDKVEHLQNDPPSESAEAFEEGFKKHGPAGQLFVVRGGKWEKF